MTLLESFVTCSCCHLDYVKELRTPNFRPFKGPESHTGLFSPTALHLAHQNRTIAIASDFRVDGVKSPEFPQKEWVLGSEIAARNRKSLATFHRTLKSECSIAFSCLQNRSDFRGPRWASQSQIAKFAAISVRYGTAARAGFFESCSNWSPCRSAMSICKSGLWRELHMRPQLRIPLLSNGRTWAIAIRRGSFINPSLF